MTRTRLALLLLSAALAATGFAVNARRPQPAGALPPGTAVVTKVVDGDTLRVRLADTEEPVRLIGVDTPESVKPGTPVECFAMEASSYLAQLVPPGTAVRLVRDIEARDRYGRLLAYVYRSRDGLFVNLTLAKDGYAAPLTIPPNVAHAEQLAAAAGQARRADAGLWSACGGPHEPAGRPPPPAAAGSAAGAAPGSSAGAAHGSAAGAPPGSSAGPASGSTAGAAPGAAQRRGPP